MKHVCVYDFMVCGLLNRCISECALPERSACPCTRQLVSEGAVQEHILPLPTCFIWGPWLVCGCHSSSAGTLGLRCGAAVAPLVEEGVRQGRRSIPDQTYVTCNALTLLPAYLGALWYSTPLSSCGSAFTQQVEQGNRVYLVHAALQPLHAYIQSDIYPPAAHVFQTAHRQMYGST